MPRPIFEIAREIKKDWIKVNFGAKPYLQAMLELNTLKDYYGIDSAKEIVIRFLCNANTWRGETARRIKEEFKEMLNV